MALHVESRSGLILVLCAAVLCGCGESSTSGPPSQLPSAGNTGVASTGTAGAPGAGVGGTGVGGTGVAGSGTGGSVAGSGGAGGANAAGAGGAPAVTAPFVYLGSTNGQISIYKLDTGLGALSLVKSVTAGNYPSFLAFDPSLAHLYAVNEPDAKVAAFSVNAKTGDLTLLNRVDSGGADTAFVGVDHSGKYVMVANYTGGTTRIFPIGADGSLGAPSDNKSPGMNSHMILTDPANKFAFVMNLGSNTISQYAFDAASGTLTPNSVPTVATAAGAGPRHLAFHPNGKFAYLIAELADTLSAYSYDATLGQLTFLQTLSTLPVGANGASNSCAEVVEAPSGKFVYGSNRWHDSIATFSIDAATGKLTFIGTTPSGGNVPRSFTLSADGKLMLVANESGNVTSFAISVETGALTKLKSLDVPQKPQFVGIVVLPGG